MKILLVETSPVSQNAVTVHVRNAVLIADYLKSAGHNSRLVWDESQIDVNEQYDIILFFAASFYFKFNKFAELLDNQKSCRIGWCTNEFELFQNNFLKGRTDFLVTNFVEKAVKKAHTYKDFLKVNLNTLVCNATPTTVTKTRDICYYGTFRKYRVKYFRKWLQGENIILSCSKKNWDKFAQCGCDCLVTTAFRWESGSEQLALFKASLYIEDTKTHTHFNHFANRFYEALNCNTIPVFDPSCIETIKQENEYWIPDEFICEPDNWKLNIDGFKHKDEFFTKNRAVALSQKAIVLKQIESFLTSLF